MDIEKVIQDLNRRFTAPLPEFYQRRIIFWYDEDREFEDKLDEITLTNAKSVALNGHNAFTVKKLLSYDDTSSNFLVYCPVSYDRPDDNWLIDIELYSEEFRADLISIWMDEMGLTSNFAMRKEVKHYRKFFNAKERRAKVIAQSKIPERPAQLHMAVMAAICGIKDAKPNQILQSVFRAGLDKATNPIYQDFVNYGAQDAFWAMVHQGTGYREEEGGHRTACNSFAADCINPYHVSGAFYWAGTDLSPFPIRHTAMILCLTGCGVRIISNFMILPVMWKKKRICRSDLASWN